MPYSALVVPVPEAEHVVPRAHIALLAPFGAADDLTDGLLADLAAFFADCVPWSYRLSQVARFPGGGRYLAPEPAAPFRSLTHELRRRFGEPVPYETAFGDVVPHLSVGEEFSVGDPIMARAASAELWRCAGEEAEVLASFLFGTLAA